MRPSMFHVLCPCCTSTTCFASRNDEPGRGTAAGSGTSPARADSSSRCMRRWRVEVYTGKCPPPPTTVGWGRVGAWLLMGGGRVVCISQLSIYIALNKIDIIWLMHILSSESVSIWFIFPDSNYCFYSFIC